MEALANCPFCKGVNTGGLASLRDHICVQCAVCEASGPWKLTPEEAEAAWNRSAEPTPAVSTRCPYCDDTGDVHTPTGEWRGACTCLAGTGMCPDRSATPSTEPELQLSVRPSEWKTLSPEAQQRLLDIMQSPEAKAKIREDRLAEGRARAAMMDKPLF